MLLRVLHSLLFLNIVTGMDLISYDFGGFNLFDFGCADNFDGAVALRLMQFTALYAS